MWVQFEMSHPFSWLHFLTKNIFKINEIHTDNWILLIIVLLFDWNITFAVGWLILFYGVSTHISTLNGFSLKLVDKFTYRERHRHATSKGMDSYSRLAVIWKPDLTDKMKRSFFQTAVVSILLYGCTTLTLTKHMEKKLDGNYTRKEYWTIPGDSTSQSSSCTATNHLSRKPSKLDESDMRETAGEVGSSS